MLLSIFLFVVYIINLPVVRPPSCLIIYYFDTPTLGRRHQSFDRVTSLSLLSKIWGNNQPREGYWSYLTFLDSFEQVLMVWFFPQVSVFYLEEGCVCCSHDCCRFWQEGLGFSFHHVFGHLSSALALFSRSTLGDLHAAGRFQSSLWERGLFPAELQLDLGERKKARACSLFWKNCPFLSPCCIYTTLKCKRGVWRAG